MRRDSIRDSAGWRDAPDIQFVWQGALDKVERCRVGRPQGEVRVEPDRCSEDGPSFRSRIAVGDEQRVSGPGRMVHEPGAVGRPVELGYAFKVWPRLSAQRWHGPGVDVVAVGGVPLAGPECDKRVIRGEPQGADGWIDDFRCASASQVVKLSRTDLRNPDVHWSIPVRLKRNEM